MHGTDSTDDFVSFSQYEKFDYSLKLKWGNSGLIKQKNSTIYRL